MTSKSNNSTVSAVSNEIADYFGIEVKVLSEFEHCSIIRYGDLTVVVDTADLMFAKTMKTAA